MALKVGISVKIHTPHLMIFAKRRFLHSSSVVVGLGGNDYERGGLGNCTWYNFPKPPFLLPSSTSHVQFSKTPPFLSPLLLQQNDHF